ncbi:MAG: hypothetical protein ACUZ8O_09745 [Candidatus Anammoxibacter sp.]
MIWDKMEHTDTDNKKAAGKEKTILLRQLLNIVVMESADIEDGNIDKLTEYSSMKNKVMGKIKDLNNELDVEQSIEVERLIKDIQKINEKNVNNLSNLRKKLKDKFAGLDTNKKTLNAYFSNAITQELGDS